jgi:hypothetical protein
MEKFTENYGDISPRERRDERLEKESKKEDIDKAFQRGKTILRDYTSKYYKGRISEKDLGDVIKKAGEFAKKDKGEPSSEATAKLAKIMEAFLVEYGQPEVDDPKLKLRGYFGGKATIAPASPYDDYFRGTDQVVIFKNEENETQSEATTLSIDATFSTAADKVEEKIQRICDKILEKDDFMKIKYPPLKEGGSEILAPKVILAISKNTIEDISSKLIRKNNPKEKVGLSLEKIRNENSLSIARSSVQFQIIQEIISQCEFFRNFCLDNDRPEMAEKYAAVGKKFNEILLEKRGTVKDTGQRDLGFEEINQTLEKLSSRIAAAKVAA